MIPQVTTLDGTPSLSVVKGQEYLVPCVWGIPVICPSHVDHGTEGPTGCHWHTDDRFGYIGRDYDYWSEHTSKELGCEVGDSIRSDILKDDGQPIGREKLTAIKTVITPSGAVWSSLLWLYQNLGTEVAKDGHCVHHRTPLVEINDCLMCPAHGMEFQKDGKPKYKAPFYLVVRWIDFKHKIQYAREQICGEGHRVTFNVAGSYDIFPKFKLEDADRTTIMEFRSEVRIERKLARHHKLTCNIGAWPESGKCPSLVRNDPREKSA